MPFGAGVLFVFASRQDNGFVRDSSTPWSVGGMKGIGPRVFPRSRWSLENRGDVHGPRPGSRASEVMEADPVRQVPTGCSTFSPESATAASVTVQAVGCRVGNGARGGSRQGKLHHLERLALASANRR